MPEALIALVVIGILLIVGWLKERRKRQPVRYRLQIQTVGGDPVYLYAVDGPFEFERNTSSNYDLEDA